VAANRTGPVHQEPGGVGWKNGVGAFAGPVRPGMGDTRMKWVIFFWALPLVILGSWYTLSYYDINFGYIILSRQMHDVVFQVYGNVLGIPPEDIPPLVLKAIVVDTMLLVAIMSFRRRKAIAAWWKQRQSSNAPAASLEIDDSLSSAP
jgi:hypothetical protein